MKRLIEIGVVLVVICVLAAAATAIIGQGTADVLYGQAAFTSAQTGADTGPGRLAAPFAVDVDDTGNLYIGEEAAYRVVICTGTTGAPADTFADIFVAADSSAATQPGTSAIRIQVPTAVKADSWGNLWVVDTLANRILRFNGMAAMLSTAIAAVDVDTQADLVIGQASFTTAYSGASDTLLNSPHDIAFDMWGNLYVSDRGNDRILRYNNTAGAIADTTADQVLGSGSTNQNFDSSISGTSDTMLNDPRGIAIDINGNLWVADGGNNRLVLFNDADSSAATFDATIDLIVGQAGPLASYNGVSDTMLSSNIQDLEVDLSGRLWIADDGNNRVVYLNDNNNDGYGVISDTTFDGRFGQPTFDTGLANNFGLGSTSRSSSGLSSPTGLAFDKWGNLYIADNANNRVLYVVIADVLRAYDDDDNCFVATAAYGEESSEVATLRVFRDETLLSNRLGRAMVNSYYTYGPSAASMVKGSSAARFVTKTALVPVVGFASLANLLGLTGAILLMAAAGFGVALFRRS